MRNCCRRDHRFCRRRAGRDDKARHEPQCDSRRTDEDVVQMLRLLSRPQRHIDRIVIPAEIIDVDRATMRQAIDLDDVAMHT